MRFVKADYEKEWFFALLLQVPHRLLREVSPRHVGIHRAEGSASAVEPNAGRISKWFPKGLDFNARGQRGLAFRSQPLLVLSESIRKSKPCLRLLLKCILPIAPVSYPLAL